MATFAVGGSPMRLRWLGCGFFLLGVLMLNPEMSPGQPGGGKGGFFPGKGGFSGKRGFDPERSFNFIAKNSDVIDFSKMDPNQRRFATMMFERNGIPIPSENAVVSRAQFVEAFNKAQAARGNGPSGSPGSGPSSFTRGPGGGPPGSSSGGPPGGFQGRTFTFGGSGGGPGGPVIMQGSGNGGPPQLGGGPGFSRGPGGPAGGEGMSDERIQEMFGRYDRNRDGKIDYDEASDRTKPEFRTLDANGDGGLDVGEYRTYIQKRFGGGDSNSSGGNNFSGNYSNNGGPGGNDRFDPRGDPNRKEEPALIAIRYGKLPEGLPSWWNDLDTDKDGQVGLYEWRQGARDMKEFLTMDLNTDGLLAPQEMLRYAAIKAEKDRLLAAEAAEEGLEIPGAGSGRDNRNRTNGRNGGSNERRDRRDGGSTGNRGPWGGNFQPKGGFPPRPGDKR